MTRNWMQRSPRSCTIASISTTFFAKASMNASVCSATLTEFAVSVIIRGMPRQRRDIDVVVPNANAPDHAQPRRSANFSLAKMGMPECHSIYCAQRGMQALWRVLVIEKDTFYVPSAFHDIPTRRRETLGQQQT